VSSSLTIADVARTLAAYEARYGPPSGHVDVLRLAVAAAKPLTARTDLPVHVTSGAVPRRADGRLLQVRHRILGTWLFPGGHLEPDDASLAAAAQRELAEETGLTGAVDESAGLPVPVDIDVHVIPPNPTKGEPEHYHADFRFLLAVDDAAAVELQADEVSDWRWVEPTEIPNQGLAPRLHALHPVDDDDR
jgi:8-oxo-dGTP pyrophosphatase MutT (NUDIX family)